MFKFVFLLLLILGQTAATKPLGAGCPDWWFDQAFVYQTQERVPGTVYRQKKIVLRFHDLRIDQEQETGNQFIDFGVMNGDLRLEGSNLFAVVYELGPFRSKSEALVGTVTERYQAREGLCLKLKLNPEIKLTEHYIYSSSGCEGPLAFLCPTKRAVYLELKIEQNFVEYAVGSHPLSKTK